MRALPDRNARVLAASVALVVLLAGAALQPPLLLGGAVAVEPGTPHGPAASTAGRSSLVGGPGLSVPYVLQEGLEFAEENGEAGIPPVYLTAELTLPNTTYPTAWSLSGLSSTGDRYLVWGGYDIPYTGGGCPTSGYSLGYQIGSSAGTEGSAGCAASISPASGDEIELGLDLACGGTVGDLCLTLEDQTLAKTFSTSPAQPTPTATYFENDLPSQPNAHGYFTGVETVAADEVAPSGCLDFSGMPAVSYYLSGYLPTDSGNGFLGLNLSEYQTLSNETEPDGSVCASYLSPAETMPSTTATQYYQGGGTSDGSHWMSVENWTSVVGTASFGRFQTDTVPVTATMTLNRTAADEGQLVRANVTASGGSGPYTCAWYLNGGPLAGSACALNVTVTAPGSLNISALAYDSEGDDGLAWGVVNGYSDPTLLAPLANPGSNDLGQSVEFVAQLSGGAGGFTYAWTVSLPPADCGATTAATLTCAPTGPGTTEVSVAVRDALNASATSPVLSFTTYPDPTVSVAVASGGRATADVGQPIVLKANASGGSGGYQYGWNTPPWPCVPNGASETCTPNLAGPFDATVRVTDSDGGTATASPIRLTIDPRPTVNLSTPTPTLALGANLTLDASAGGGEAPYSYAWSGLPEGCSPPLGAKLGCRPSLPGTYNVSVEVTDSLGGNASATLSVAVLAPTNEPAQGTLLPWLLLGAIGLLAVVAIVVAIRIGRRRGRSPPSPPPEGYTIVSGPTVRPPEAD
jgi:hypothetical protein